MSNTYNAVNLAGGGNVQSYDNFASFPSPTGSGQLGWDASTNTLYFDEPQSGMWTVGSAASPSLTATYIGFGSPGNALTGEASFTYDSGTNTISVPNATITTAITLSGFQVTDILDEDDMISNSNTALATQQSIRAYVDSVAAGQNEASEISYDNSTSGIPATDVQDAIDNVDGRVDSLEANAVTIVTDSNSIDLTNTAGDLTASLIFQDTNTVDLEVDASGLKADVTTQNTASINLSEDASGLKADLNVSTAAPDAAHITVKRDIQPDGLRSQLGLGDGLEDDGSDNLRIKRDGGTGSFLDLDSNGLSVRTLDEDNMASNSDSHVPTQQSVKAYVDSVAAGQDEASEISYDNSTSGLTATDVQSALDEIDGNLDNHLSGAASRHDATEIDYERLDGSKVDVQSTSDNVELSLTDLDDRKLSTLGNNTMSADLDMGTNDLTNVGLVDGRDVSVDGSNLDDHLANDATSKHDADQIDYERLDGSKVDIQASSDNIESAVTDLDDQKLSRQGSNSMAADLNMGSNNITNVGTVDGRDVSVDGTALDSHLADDATSKHDADQIDYERADGAKVDVQASSDEVESALTDLDDQKLSRQGNNTMAADLDMGSNSITNVNQVDGRDVSADGTALDDHLTNDALSKHDADQIDYERADGSKKNIQAASDTVEPALSDLDDAIGTLPAAPTNYTAADPSITADHLAGIDTALGTALGTEFADDVFRVTDNTDSTKKIALEASAITTATTRTVTMPDADVDLADVNQALLQDGSRQLLADLDANSNKITNVATPTVAGDATNKSYVDSVAAGMRPKGNVAVATTADITLSGLQTIDGYAVQAGDRVLVKDQTTTTENGIYEAAAGAWSRTVDQDNSPLAEILNGVLVPSVLNGTVNQGTPFFISSVGTGTDNVHQIGVDAIIWDEFTSPTQLTAGDGIDITANVISADVSDFAGTGLEDDGANDLRIASSAAGNGLTGGSGSALSVQTDSTGGANLATSINVSANGVAVQIDDTSIGENGSNQLEVKDDGVTFAKLNSSAVATDLTTPNNTTLPTTQAVDDAINAVDTVLTAHLDGGASKHDATEIDYERLDGSKIDIQASSDDVETALTDLDDNKLSTAGNNAMAANLDMGGNAITNVGNVDGRDVSADGTALDGHLADDAASKHDADQIDYERLDGSKVDIQASSDNLETAVTDLDDAKLSRSGNNAMAADLDMGTNDIINVGLVDGVDVFTVSSDLTDHLADDATSKHDADQIDYERLDGSKVDIQAASDTVEPALTDLDDRKLSRLGNNTMGAALDMGGFSVTNVDQVDGRDVSADGTTLDTHIADDGLSKHDADQIDYERLDGSKKNIQASSDRVEAALSDLDDAIGSLDATPNNYTPTDASIVADHLSAIDSQLAAAGGTEFSDTAFRITDNVDNSKKIAFEANAITTATERTITMPDADVNLADVNQAVLQDGTRALTADLSAGTNKITNLATPTVGTDASTKQYVDDEIAAITVAANEVTYSNATSGLTATDVQAAIDEVDSTLDAHLAATPGKHAATQITYDNSTSGLVASTVQAAFDEIDSTVDGKQEDVITTEGDIVIGDNGGAASRLAIGANGSVLTSDGTTAAWTIPTTTDERVKVSANDTTAGFLEDKIVTPATSGLAITTLNDGGNEDVQISLDINGTTDKASPAGADEIILSDSADSFNTKKADIGSLAPVIDHDQLLNFVGNEHIDHSSVDVETAADSGLTGGGDLTATRSISVDITGTTSESTVESTDEFLMYDTSAGVLRKTTRSDIVSGLATTSTGDIAETNFAGANNATAGTSITGFAFANGTVRSFKAQVSVVVDATANLYEVFTLEGIQRGADWAISQSSTGDDSQVDFNINASGQITYASGNYAGFNSLTMKFRAETTSI